MACDLHVCIIGYGLNYLNRLGKVPASSVDFMNDEVVGPNLFLSLTSDR